MCAILASRTNFIFTMFAKGINRIDNEIQIIENLMNRIYYVQQQESIVGGELHNAHNKQD